MTAPAVDDFEHIYGRPAPGDEPAPAWKTCTQCGQSWDNGLGACACQPKLTRIIRLAAELARQHEQQCGPGPGDPWDADLWAGEAASLLAQIAGQS